MCPSLGPREFAGLDRLEYLAGEDCEGDLLKLDVAQVAGDGRAGPTRKAQLCTPEGQVWRPLQTRVTVVRGEQAGWMWRRTGMRRTRTTSG